MTDTTMSFRSRLNSGSTLLGGWIQIGHPACAEIMGRAGFDWVCFDLEHGAIDLAMLADLCRTLQRFNATPIARLPANDPIWIHRALDAGVGGLIIPMVKTAAEAEAAVREAKYPPRGQRGFGYSRANMHGMDFESYIADANDRIAMVMQIEHRDAIEQLEKIAAVPDVDGMFIGPLDLSGSMGICGQLSHPDMQQALSRFRQLCRDRDLPAGMHIVRPDPEQISRAIEQGYRLIALGLDNVFLQEGATRCLEEARDHQRPWPEE